MGGICRVPPQRIISWSGAWNLELPKMDPQPSVYCIFFGRQPLAAGQVRVRYLTVPCSSGKYSYRFIPLTHECHGIKASSPGTTSIDCFPPHTGACAGTHSQAANALFVP